MCIRDRYFSVRAGTAADERCARRVGGYARLADSTLRALVHVLTCEAGKTYAFALTGPAREQFCRMAEDYVQYHLDVYKRQMRCRPGIR